MLYQMNDVTFSFGDRLVLDHTDFFIRGTERIAVTGANGAGKTTLLRLIAGELSPDRDDRRRQTAIQMSRALSIGMLSQTVKASANDTVNDYICAPVGGKEPVADGEGDRLLTGFGFAKTDKTKLLRKMSGGQQTKIGFIRLLLQQPDILLLDEPTNYLDAESILWLQEYLRGWKKALVYVSHDRYFMDRTAQVVYELTQGKLTRYPGNYTEFRNQKQKDMLIAAKAYRQQQEERKRQEELIERFKRRPRKAAFARARRSMMNRQQQADPPPSDGAHIFTGEIVPKTPGSRRVIDCEKLQIGYSKPLQTVTWSLRRGRRTALIGANGTGKTTFLRTLAGELSPLCGKLSIGKGVEIGYFDQKSADIADTCSVLAHFQKRFPLYTQKEARRILAAYLFAGEQAQKRVCDLSGGEKSRLVLCELLTAAPQLLLLDEPTAHMDIYARETIESALCIYKGTLLTVSHDRYFIDRVAQELLIFGTGEVQLYPFSYTQYLTAGRRNTDGIPMRALQEAAGEKLREDLRSVPAPVRHLYTLEESYDDWQLRLAADEMLRCRQEAEALFKRWQESGEIFLGDGTLKQEYEDALKRWHEACCLWYDHFLNTQEGTGERSGG